jgi:hypothetical protein
LQAAAFAAGVPGDVVLVQFLAVRVENEEADENRFNKTLREIRQHESRSGRRRRVVEISGGTGCPRYCLGASVSAQRGDEPAATVTELQNPAATAVGY